MREAADNTTALDLVNLNRFEVVLTGQETSAKEDLEFLRTIRRIHPHTRVIILVGESTPEDVVQAIREGAFSYFCRPFSVAELSQAVHSAIEAAAWDDGIEIVAATPDWVRLVARCDLQVSERLLRFVY
ncbi:MAG: response regulator [Acidobacteriaceae bacterium]|nr:response regulator [Acidobacteriaceae bacterium]MBV9443018.1 response regulator [Acidobacteriaceae bacterium]